MFECEAGVCGCEVPIGFCVVFVAAGLPCLDFCGMGFFVSDAAVQALDSGTGSIEHQARIQPCPASCRPRAGGDQGCRPTRSVRCCDVPRWAGRLRRAGLFWCVSGLSWMSVMVFAPGKWWSHGSFSAWAYSSSTRRTRPLAIGIGTRVCLRTGLRGCL